MHKFKLFIVEGMSNSTDMINRIKKMLNNKLKDQYELVIIDVIKNNEAAIENKILATPTLIKVFPDPKVRIIGNFYDEEKVLKALNLIL